MDGKMRHQALVLVLLMFLSSMSGGALASSGFQPAGPGGDDADGDGLNDTQEANIGTDPSLPDTDIDGLDDGDEVNTYLTDPLDNDTDDDGLLDGEEVNTYFIDPLDNDTDGDGLLDGDEVNNYSTDPGFADSDRDGVDDGDEIANGSNPNDADTDNDGIGDGDEALNGTNATLVDTDFDGLEDGEEDSYGTSAIVADSDGDGVNDGDEVENGTDPTDPADFPTGGDDGGGDGEEEIPDVEPENVDTTQLPAMGISVSYDYLTERSTISWFNIGTSGLDAQQELALLTALQGSTYDVYRHTERITIENIDGLQAIASVSSCVEITYTFCANGSSPFHEGHATPYLILPQVSGEFYYAIMTIQGNGVRNTDLYCGQNSLCNPVNETTEPVHTPSLLTATFNPLSETTTLAWVNYNQNNPGALPEDGANAMTIHVWRHSTPVNRSTGYIMSLNSENLITTLAANNNQIVLQVDSDIQRTVYYSVTYLLPNHYGAGQDYEDFRFSLATGELNTNTLVNPVNEDTKNPVLPTEVSAEFDASANNGTAITNITWIDSVGELDEVYTIWRSRLPIIDVYEPGVSIVGSSMGGLYPYQVNRGTLGTYYYCVTIEDSMSKKNTSVGEGNCVEVFEDTFDPWIAEPTNVTAEYLGDSVTRVSWNDQLGVEGEVYHVWRSSNAITNITFTSVPPELVATADAGIGFADVNVDGDWVDDSYYCVTTQARYNLEEFEEFEDREYDDEFGTYEDFRFIQNCADSVPEDTTPPRKTVLGVPTVFHQYNTISIEFQQIIEETGERYYVYRSTDLDVFDVNGSSSVDMPAWELIAGPLYFPDEESLSLSHIVYMTPGTHRDIWYAVAAEDSSGNLMRELEADYNAHLVSEDTLGPDMIIRIPGLESTSLKAGTHAVYVDMSENPGTYSPKISIIASDSTFLANLTTMSGSFGSLTYTYSLTLTEDTPAGPITISITGYDMHGNPTTTLDTNYSIDAAEPTLVLYSPSPTSTGSSYRYGDNLLISGGASDDVGIVDVQIRFTRNTHLATENQVTEVWQSLDLLEVGEVDENMVSFYLSYAANNFEIGEHRLDIKSLDAAGNYDETSVTFYVDRCEQLDNGVQSCIFADSLKPPEEQQPVELEMFAPPYLFSYALAGFNLFAFIMIIVTLSTVGRSVREDEDDPDDWMMEFIGKSAEPDMDDIAGVKSDPMDAAPERDIDQAMTLDDDDDDLFGSGAPQPKQRRKRSSAKRRRVGAKSDDDFDDDFEDDDKPKRRRIGRK